MQILTGCSKAGISCLGTCLQYNLRNNNNIRRKVFYVHSIRTIKVTSFVGVDADPTEPKFWSQKAEHL
jgi:hypothetical protein